MEVSPGIAHYYHDEHIVMFITQFPLASPKDSEIYQIGVASYVNMLLL